MRSVANILSLLGELDGTRVADDFEDQDLDFKRWVTSSVNDSVNMLLETAICLANGGGGTVVVGVAERENRRATAVLGVPADIDSNLLVAAIFQRTDPSLSVYFDEVLVPEGTGRILLMQVPGEDPPYTDTQGAAKIRVQKNCEPLTGSLRALMMSSTPRGDFSAGLVDGDPVGLVSASAVERLVAIARSEQIPGDLAELAGLDLLSSIGGIRDGRLTLGALMLAGTPEAIAANIPGYRWSYLRMESDISYNDSRQGQHAIPLALDGFAAAIANPIQTAASQFVHTEHRTYPDIALREALLNAFCHRDLRLPGPTMVKQYADRIEVSSPGGFIGGINPDNVLHHTPVARNTHLVEMLTALRLVNRANLGMTRMFKAMLIEGKEPPRIQEAGAEVRVTFRAMKMSEEFRAFVAEQDAMLQLSIDELLVLYLASTRGEISLEVAAQACQRSQVEMREVLDHLCDSRGWLEVTGTPPWLHWVLAPSLEERLGPGDLSPDAARRRVLRLLRSRAQTGAPGLGNSDVRRLTGLDRLQVNRLIHELEPNGVVIEGHGRGAKYVLRGAP